MMQKTDTAVTNATQAQPDLTDLKNAGMPATNRTNMFTKMAGVAAMSMALGSEPALAQSPTNAPTSPTPATAAATPGYRVLSPEEAQQYTAAQAAPPSAAPAAPAAGPAMNPNQSIVTVLEKRPFCVDQRGAVLPFGDRRLTIGLAGETRQGAPSYGECLRVMAEGVAHLKQMNGGVIPGDCNVKVVVYRPNDELKLYINPNVVPDIVHLSPQALRAALADNVTKNAITKLNSETLLAVKNEGNSLTMTYKDQKTKGPVTLTVELEKRLPH